MALQKIRGSENTSPFIQKLHQMLQNQENKEIIRFNDLEKQVEITNKSLLQKILIKHFRHAKYESFIRQLNWYGFYKVNNNSLHCYRHSNLEKGLSLFTIKSRRTSRIKTFKPKETLQIPRENDRTPPEISPISEKANSIVPGFAQSNQQSQLFLQPPLYYTGVNYSLPGINYNSFSYLPYNLINWNTSEQNNKFCLMFSNSQ